MQNDWNKTKTCKSSSSNSLLMTWKCVAVSVSVEILPSSLYSLILLYSRRLRGVNLYQQSRDQVPDRKHASKRKLRKWRTAIARLNAKRTKLIAKRGEIWGCLSPADEHPNPNHRVLLVSLSQAGRDYFECSV